MSLIGGGSVTDGSDLPIASGPALDSAHAASDPPAGSARDAAPGGADVISSGGVAQ